MARLKKEHYDKNTKLEQWIDYYECPVCFEISDEFIECPACTSRSCKKCALDFSKGEHAKDPTAYTKGIYKCIVCHKVLPHKSMHKFLFKLL